MCACTPVCALSHLQTVIPPTPKAFPHSQDGSQTGDGDGGVDECGMAESRRLARRAADEGVCEARVHLNIQSEIKMCLERCQRKRTPVYFSSLDLITELNFIANKDGTEMQI